MSDDNQKRIEELEIENAFLKQKLKEYGYVFFDSSHPLSTKDKIKIYREYFHGRDDIYAHRYFSKKNNRFEYSFVCANKFAQECQIMAGKNCGGCKSRCPVSMTDEAIHDHMTVHENKYPLAIYPLLKDNTCWLLAFDFDDDFWFECLLSLYRVCRSKQLYPLMERSRSGEGGHLWLFFATPITAMQARNLGSYLLSEAMKSNPHIRFNSFDRMFPSQDVLSTQEAIGNCIALPLQYDAYKMGNTTFIDERGVIIDKPIEYLQSIPRIEQSQVSGILNAYQGIDQFFADENNQIAMNLDIESGYSEELNIIRDSRLRISKKNLNALTLRDLRRIGSMPNPEYYECLRMHRYINTAKTPRILSEVEESDQELFLPRGTENAIRGTFASCIINFVDQTCTGTPLDLQFTGQLRPDQIDAVKCAEHENMGVIESPTSSGKTIMALYIMAQKNVSTLVIVPKVSLIAGWKEKAESFLNIPKPVKKRDTYIGEYHGNKKKLKYHLDIAVINSLANIKDLPELLSHYGMVIIDECHHVGTATFASVLKNCSSKYIYSFSATPKRSDKLDRIMFMYCGRIIFKASENTKLALLNFDKILVKQMTPFRPLAAPKDYTKMITEMVKNVRRNNQIFKDISRTVREKRHILVLSDRKEHLNTLYEMVSHITDKCFMVVGDSKAKQRREIFAQLQEETGSYVLFSTSSLLSEGYDLPSLDTLFLTMPIRWEGKLIQCIGRIHRNYEGKTMVKVYDYVDYNCPTFVGMFKARLKEYYANNYQLQEETESQTVENKVFSNTEYFKILQTDISQAKQSVFISTGYISISIYRRLIQAFDAAERNCASIQIETDSRQKNLQEVTEFIQGLGITVNQVTYSKHVAILDQHLVWHGTFDILSTPKSDDYLIRLDSKELAEEIFEK